MRWSPFKGGLRDFGRELLVLGGFGVDSGRELLVQDDAQTPIASRQAGKS